MRYEIQWYSSYESLIAEKISEEIQRFDIRSDVVINQFQNTNTENIDALIIIGNRHNFRKLRKQVIPTFFLFQSIQEHLFGVLEEKKGIKIYQDLPSSNSLDPYHGFHLFDVLKSVEAKQYNHANSYIPIIEGYENRKKINVNRLKNSIQSNLNSASFDILNIEENFLSSIQKIREANAAIVTSALGEIIALFFNVPFIRIVRKGLFGKMASSKVSSIANQNVVKVISSKENNEITEELSRILNDHQYCASILAHFQETKQSIGIQPSLRNIARDIVDTLED